MKKTAQLRRKGFTLIELLVVMAIIGILATIALGYYRGAQIKARDARRKHDLSQIQKAMELYYNDKETYPSSFSFGSEWSDSGALYMKEVPDDPTSGYTYFYQTDTVTPGVWYRLYARLENEHDLLIDDSISTDCGADECNFKVGSPNEPPLE